MTDPTDEQVRQSRTLLIVKIYPIVVVIVSVFLNLFVLGVDRFAVDLPSPECIRALVVAAVLLLVNHTWLMTTTELTRVRFRMYATPEEWAASGTDEADAPADGMSELNRRHNAHRNTTENSLYFVMLALSLALVSPTPAAAWTWIVGYPVARLGYTYSYLVGRNGARGLFMSLGLLAVYGMASYLVISLLA